MLPRQRNVAKKYSGRVPKDTFGNKSPCSNMLANKSVTQERMPTHTVVSSIRCVSALDRAYQRSGSSSRNHLQPFHANGLKTLEIEMDRKQLSELAHSRCRSIHRIGGKSKICPRQHKRYPCRIPWKPLSRRLKPVPMRW